MLFGVALRCIEEKVIRQTSYLILIALLLIVQVGQAFASASACEGHDNMMMTGHMMDTSTEMVMDHSHHMMMMEEAGDQKELMQDCCQKDCCCPVAIVSVAAIIDSNVNPSLNIHSLQLSDVNDSLVSLVLPLLQRPPNSPKFITI